MFAYAEGETKDIRLCSFRYTLTTFVLSPFIICSFNVRMRPGRDVWWDEAVPPVETECPVEWMDSEDGLFILYSSGSTGRPKGLLHTTGGYMVYAATTAKYVFDLHPDDVYWCTADIGWITGSFLFFYPFLAILVTLCALVNLGQTSRSQFVIILAKRLSLSFKKICCYVCWIV